MKWPKRISIAATVLLSAVTYGQDPHFTQFFASPLTLNPAFTGLFDGDYRMTANYRSQWPSVNNAFMTATASVDMAVLQKKLPEYDRWGVGLLALNDRSGNRILDNSHVTVSTAYHKGLDENGYHQITVGFQGTFTSKTLDISRANFEDELTAVGFTGVTSEIFSSSRMQINYFDMHAGLLYSGSTNGIDNFYLGLSTYHVNRPNESFLGGSFILEPRVTFHGGGYFPFHGNKTFHVSMLHQRQAGAFETIAGAALSSDINHNPYNPINLYGGLMYRLGDAVAPYVGIEFSSFRLGYSYDINTSAFKTASNRRGGNEISLIMVKKPVDQALKKLHCPKF